MRPFFCVGRTPSSIEAAAGSQTPEKHQAVVEIIHRILAGKNGVRH